jgi:MinD superfamily P-loop ATPase
VEEPNGHIFLNTKEEKTLPVNAMIPTIDEEKCNGCGVCSNVCEFNAIVVIDKKVMVFDEMCHGCANCMLSCPQKAIFETPKKIGTISIGNDKNIKTVKGLLDVGNAMSPPIIREVKRQISKDDELVFLDCPPGTSCPMVTAVKGCDFIILVTEPTPFGLNDLVLAVETVRELGLPFGVIINRSDAGDNRVVEYCKKENIDLLLEIPQSIKAAQAYSKGENVLCAIPDLKENLQKLIIKLKTKINERAA